MTFRFPHILALISLVSLAPHLVSECTAQTPQWRQRAQTIQPRPSASHCMTYDAGRGRTVLFQTVTSGFPTETWEWDGNEWSRRSTGGPTERTAAGMCYDSARRRTVLFGGSLGSGETWEWDGSSWTLRGSDGPARYFHGMAYDPVRGRTVIQGGFRPGVGRLADTWEWDGSTWIQAATTGPGPRQQHTMAFDPSRGRIVLYGGNGTTNSAMGDLWEWDGSAWSLVNDAGPLAADSALVGDSARQRLVLLTGWPSPGVTWEWDGSAWTQLADSGPPSRTRHAMAFDEARGETVLFGGASTEGFGYTLDDTWAWNGTAWSRKNIGPAARPPAAMTFDPDRNRTLMVSSWFGSGVPCETWEWDGSNWAFAASGPPSRQNAGIAYDTARRRAIFFGGNVYAFVDYFFYGDTWAWDGGTWTQLDVPGPSPRAGHAMAYDPRRDRVVVFGGWSNEEKLLSETWEWDGSAWALASTSGPEGREGASMVYDHGRQRIVLFGGRSTTQFATWLNDTWEWDGISWTQVAAPGPSPRAYAAMQYDAVGDRILLFGGELGNQPSHNDTWELRGATWSALPVAGPQTLAYAGSAFDAARGQMVVFGGLTQGGLRSDTWEFGIDCPADYNHDRALNSQDFFDYLAAFFKNDPAADFDRDGIINSQDFFDFLAAFFAGCP